METAQCSKMNKKTTMKIWALVVRSCHTFLCAFLTHFCYFLLSCCATCYHSVVVQLNTTQLLCNLSSLSRSATFHSVGEQPVARLLCNLSPLSHPATESPLSCSTIFHHSVVLRHTTRLLRNLSLGCCANCHYSVVLQLIATQLFWNLSPLIFAIYHEFCNLSPLGCCTTNHHAFVLQLVTTQPFRNLSLSWCATCHSVVVQLVTQLFCKVFTRCALLSLVCNVSLSCCASCPLVMLFFTHMLCDLVTLENLSHCLLG